MHPDLQNKISERLHDTAFVVLCRGSRKKFEEVARVETRREHIHPQRGWELKDCFSMPLDGRFRFELCRDWEHRIAGGRLYVVVFF